MELLQDFIRPLYSVLILCASVSFVIYVFFYAGYLGGEGVFETTGKLYEPMFEKEDSQTNLLELLEDVPVSEIQIKYNSSVQKVGDCLKFRELFLIESEEEAVLYLLDVKQNGKSVLERMTSEDLEALEEIPASFVYDSEKDLLYIFASGIYTVEIKVYNRSGNAQIYEMSIPVEST